MLDIDPREIGFLNTFPSKVNQSYLSVVLFDTMTGGSGHVFELLKENRDWLEETRKLLHTSLQCSNSDDRQNFKAILIPDNAIILSQVCSDAINLTEQFLQTILEGGSFDEKFSSKTKIRTRSRGKTLSKEERKEKALKKD